MTSTKKKKKHNNIRIVKQKDQSLIDALDSLFSTRAARTKAHNWKPLQSIVGSLSGKTSYLLSTNYSAISQRYRMLIVIPPRDA